MKLVLRLALSAVALGLLIVSVPIAASGVRVDRFPAFVSTTPTSASSAASTPASGASPPAQPGTPITHFSPPWIAGAAALVLIALILLIVVLADVLGASGRVRVAAAPPQSLED